MAGTEPNGMQHGAVRDVAPNLVGELLWDARRLAKARANARLEVVVVETRDRPRTVVGQIPGAGDPLGDKRLIRVEVAQPSWIRSLPGIYQDTDEEQADFLKRFLAVQQHVLLQTEEKLESIHTFFDPRETPEGFLPWLGSWVAMALHEGWSERRLREIIYRAVELYKLRGTAAGLKLALSLFAEVDAEIDEFKWPYPGFVVGQHAVIGHQSTLARPVFATQCFVVRIPAARSEVGREKLRTVHAVVETEKPAHAYYALEFLADEERFEEVPFLRLRLTGRIGVDTRIGGRSDEPEALEEGPGDGLPTAA